MGLLWMPSEDDLGKVAFELWHRHVSVVVPAKGSATSTPPTPSASTDAPAATSPRSERPDESAWIEKHYKLSETLPNTPDGERALAYVDRVIERTINKGRGVLPFNSILLAVVITEVTYAYERAAASDTSPVPLTFLILSLLAVASLLLSSVLILVLFRVKWEESDTYGSYLREFIETVRLIRTRSLQLQAALISSGVGLVVVIAGTTTLVFGF